MGTQAQLERRVADLERRMNAFQNGTIGGLPGATYGPTVLVNGDFESGSTNWFPAGWISTQASLAVETTAPIDGTRSLKLAEAASCSTRVGYLPSGNVGSPTIGQDVFATSVGDTWLLSSQIQATAGITHARIYAICGTTPADCYTLPGADSNWVVAADVPLTAATPSLLYGTIAVPAGRNFLTFTATLGDFATGGSVPGAGWTWLLDNCSLQQRTN